MSKKNKRVKGRTIELNEFLTEGTNAVAAGFTMVHGKIDWSDDMGNMDGPLILPTAPMASRERAIDESLLPSKPPYNAFLGNLPFEVREEEIADFFKELKVESIRLVKDSAERFRGFGYVEFQDIRSLREALNLDGDMLKNRQIKINLPNESDDKFDRSGFGRDRNNRGGFGGSRPYESELPSDWRASARTEQANRGSDYRQNDRYGNDRGERFGNRDRYNEDRGGDQGESRNWRAPRETGNRYEPPRETRPSNDGPSERPKLNLIPRTKPVEPLEVPSEPITKEEPKPKIEKPKAADIFGAAKPVDTESKLREIEQRRQQKEAEEQEKLKEENKVPEKSAEKSTKKSDAPPVRSWREESREQKEKKERKPREKRAPAAQMLEEEPIVVGSRNKFANLEVSEPPDSEEEQ